MDDRKLEVFLTTIQTGSFSKAADELNCTQSAVTQTMNSLENELGLVLLDRSHRGVHLTPAGEKLMPFILEAREGLNKLANQAKSISSGKETPVRIGCFSSIAATWLPQAIKVYRELHPTANFSIKIGTDTLSDYLVNHTIDLALGDNDRLTGFRFLPLMEDPYCAVFPKGMMPDGTLAVEQSEFSNHPFIMAPENALNSHLISLPENPFAVSCDDDSTLLSMIAQGLGATAMPKLSLKNVPENVSVYKLLPESFRTIGIALPNSIDDNVKRFVSFLQKCQKDGSIESFCNP